MKKKISLMLCLCFMVLAMTACGTDPADAEYFGMSYSDLKDGMEQDISTLVAMTDDEKEYINSYGTDVIIELLASWDETVADLGAYQGMGEFTVTKAQDTVTTEQIVKYPGRDVVVTYVYEYNYESEQPELMDANADLVYTLGEKMENAALNTLMGMGTVFIVLILISLIIYCFRFISVVQNKKKDSGEETADSTVVTQMEQRKEQQLVDDLELVAVITAAIAASEGTSADGFVVRSIHRR